MMAAVVAVVVDSRAYQRADTGSQQGADERMPIHGGCADGADASAYGGSGKRGVMTRPAGRERETEYTDEAESKDAAHSILLVRSVEQGSRVFPRGLDAGDVQTGGYAGAKVRVVCSAA
jgi:hypothetical protein